MQITKETKVEAPGLVKIFLEFGLPCLVYGEPYWGTIEEPAKRHNKDIEVLIERLNKELKSL